MRFGRRRADMTTQENMTATSYTLIVAWFEAESTAMEALEFARDLEHAGSVEYEGAMVVNRLKDGTVSSPATSEHAAGWGVLAAGPGEPARDGIHPFRHHRVKSISNSIENTLPPGSSGVVLLTKKGGMDASDHVLVDSARVTKSSVDGRVVEQLRERDGR
jgi:uncharacterized membrane protein